jgi:hypothetical protein
MTGDSPREGAVTPTDTDEAMVTPSTSAAGESEAMTSTPPPDSGVEDSPSEDQAAAAAGLAAAMEVARRGVVVPVAETVAVSPIAVEPELDRVANLLARLPISRGLVGEALWAEVEAQRAKATCPVRRVPRKWNANLCKCVIVCVCVCVCVWLLTCERRCGQNAAWHAELEKIHVDDELRAASRALLTVGAE